MWTHSTKKKSTCAWLHAHTTHTLRTHTHTRTHTHKQHAGPTHDINYYIHWFTTPQICIMHQMHHATPRGCQGAPSGRVYPYCSAQAASEKKKKLTKKTHLPAFYRVSSTCQSLNCGVKLRHLINIIDINSNLKHHWQQKEKRAAMALFRRSGWKRTSVFCHSTHTEKCIWNLQEMF